MVWDDVLCVRSQPNGRIPGNGRRRVGTGAAVAGCRGLGEEGLVVK